MDHYPQDSISEREYPNSRHDSGSSIAKSELQHSPPTQRHNSDDASPQYKSFSNVAQHQSRSNSMDVNSLTVEEDYRRYTDAPPPHSDKAYEGKSEEKQNSMRMEDYAKEISRMMGRQLVKDLTTAPIEETK